jgi:4-carboxymuconolactone decarboxylase
LAAKKDITELVWTRVWGRPGLSRQMRSVANIALLIALNRPRELRLHIVGALNNGLTREEISEIVLQCAAYCGLPAARDALGVVEEAFHLHHASLTDQPEEVQCSV